MGQKSVGNRHLSEGHIVKLGEAFGHGHALPRRREGRLGMARKRRTTRENQAFVSWTVGDVVEVVDRYRYQEGCVRRYNS